MGLQNVFREVNLVGIELDAAVLGIHELNFLNAIQLMVVEYLYIVFPQQVKVDFIAIIPDGNHKGAMLIKHLYFLP